MKKHTRSFRFSAVAMLVALTLVGSAFAAEIITATDGTQVVSAAKIKKKKAKKIALKDAGLTKSQTKYITCEKDWEDGVKVFEVSIYMPDGGEYEYTINAATGAIMEKDYDND